MEFHTINCNSLLIIFFHFRIWNQLCKNIFLCKWFQVLSWKENYDNRIVSINLNDQCDAWLSLPRFKLYRSMFQLLLRKKLTLVLTSNVFFVVQTGLILSPPRNCSACLHYLTSKVNSIFYIFTKTYRYYTFWTWTVLKVFL